MKKLFITLLGTGLVLLGAPVAHAATLVAADGDIASSTSGDSSTASLITNTIVPDVEFTLGDNAYPEGTLTNYTSYYAGTWGAFVGTTYPAPGNHDTFPPTPYSGFCDYFYNGGSIRAAIDPDCAGGYTGPHTYEFNLGSGTSEWHVFVIDTKNADVASPTFDAADATEAKNMFAADTHSCDIAIWHHPRFSDGSNHGNASDPDIKDLWKYAANKKVDVVVNGHEHNFQTFNRMDSTGAAVSDDPTVAPEGTREFVAGTGGASNYPFNESGMPPVEVFQKDANNVQRSTNDHSDTVFGALKLSLRVGYYTYHFIDTTGTEVGSGGQTDCTG